MTRKDLGDQVVYQKLSFTDFVAQYQKQMPKARLFELSLPWLVATKDFMVESTEELIVHCLFNAKQDLLIAWPLVHEQSVQRIKSLTSFYSAIAEPVYFGEDSIEVSKSKLKLLLSFIKQDKNWYTMQLGALEQKSAVAQAIANHSAFYKVFSKTDNVYQQRLGDFAQYYQQRPSQLRNTIKRRSKKLAKEHQHDIRIISTLTDFDLAFAAYKSIYQQSWKGEEYSFAFIEQVCRAAIKENKLRLGLLTVNDEPAAAQIWFVQDCLSTTGQHEVNASIFKLAYNPTYQEFSVGSLLSMALSEHVICQDKVNSIEFGMGSESYKNDWLDNKRHRLSYQIFNHRCFYGKLAIIRHVLLPKFCSKLTGKVASLFKP